MEYVLEKEFTVKELDEFLKKEFTSEEVDDIREYIVEYYECAGFDGVREKYQFDDMSKEKVLEWFGRLKYHEIELREDYNNYK